MKHKELRRLKRKYGNPLEDALGFYPTANSLVRPAWDLELYKMLKQKEKEEQE